MTNLAVKNASGATEYMKTDGAGSDVDPHVGHHAIDSVPADPFGADADAAVAAGAAGSIQAKLRRLTQGVEDLKTLIVIGTGANVIGGVTVADGSDISEGAVADAVVAAGAAGSVQAKLRRLTQGVEDLKTLVVLAAGTALIGKISAALDTASIMDGVTALTPKFAFANVAASQTDSSIVATTGATKIRVLSVVCLCGGTATTLTFNSKPAGAGAAISMLFANGANGGEVLPFNPVGWFETVVSEGLTVTTGAGSTTGIQVVYVLV